MINAHIARKTHRTRTISLDHPWLNILYAKDHEDPLSSYVKANRHCGENEIFLSYLRQEADTKRAIRSTVWTPLVGL